MSPTLSSQLSAKPLVQKEVRGNAIRRINIFEHSRANRVLTSITLPQREEAKITDSAQGGGRVSSAYCGENGVCGRKGGTFGCLGWPGVRKNARFLFGHFAPAPLNIFIIAACIRAWTFGYFVWLAGTSNSAAAGVSSFGG